MKVMIKRTTEYNGYAVFPNDETKTFCTEEAIYSLSESGIEKFQEMHGSLSGCVIDSEEIEPGDILK